jgi:NADH:ubiquinone oxidoreductase subunit K
MLIPIFDLINLNISLFIIALFGLFVIRKNLIVILIALELLALSVSLNFIVFSIYLDDIVGQLFALLAVATVGAESALGLAILILFFRIKEDVSIDIISTLKG